MSQRKVYNLTVKWDRHGYVATCPDLPNNQSLHCAGPRAAADDLCVREFGGGRYTLKFKAAGWYEATDNTPEGR